EERRLGSAEKVRTVGVQDHAVVRDFVQEVLDHRARKLELVVAEQAALDEVTVPAVHFIEAAAGNDVWLRQIQKAWLDAARTIRGQHAQIQALEIPLAENRAQALFDLVA